MCVSAAYWLVSSKEIQQSVGNFANIKPVIEEAITEHCGAPTVQNYRIGLGI
jgi:hypothetical protein